MGASVGQQGAGGTQSGTTGSTTNAIVKATSANTLGDSDLLAPGSAMLQLGGATSSYPALIRSSAIIQVVKADSSGYTDVQAGQFIGSSQIYSDAIGGFVTNAGASGVKGTQLASNGQYCWGSSTAPLSGYGDTGLGRSVAGVLKATDGDTGLGWIQDAGRDYATADQTVDSTTLTADDTISLTLKAGRKYKFTLVYFMTPGDTVADGLKFDMNGGTATMTGFEARVRVVDNVGQDVSVTNSRMTALNTAVSLTGNQPATSFTMYVDGFAEVNAAGTLIPQFAKSADAGTGVVKKKYSHIEALDYP